MAGSTKSALIIGATGQTGRHLLQNLLASPHFTRVGEYGRRVTPVDDITTGKDKLEQKVVDFEKLQESGLKKEKWDVLPQVVAEAFEKIDREYVINAAKEARNADSSVPQRLVYLSSTGANSSSPFLYPKLVNFAILCQEVDLPSDFCRSKGLTEEGLASIGYSDTIIFRPGFLAGTNRSDHRLAESIFGKLTGVLSYVSSSLQINVRVYLGKAMYLAGKLGSNDLPPAVAATKEGKADAKFTVINNATALKLAEWQK
ncbi:hypothetical protein CPB84DRAFT_1846301 [Gymnopilus junonius]|uniref:NAD(P)-binding domain-containing protein n=1 Tax=Gymnopilus junonius TaxID=109634 RepID=A0A9P5NQV0_GYMJU|nr:hypothetical protein CPB84DRAFT_1846301 [Gymnopilus junonius]